MSSRAKKKWRYRQHGIDFELKRKLMSTGVVDAETVIKTRQEKMSKLLLDFVAPYTASADSHEEFRKVVLVGLIAWNVALLPADLRQESLDGLLATAAPDTAADFQKIIDQMVERKEKYFAENRRFILAHHWTMTGSVPHLSVVSTTD